MPDRSSTFSIVAAFVGLGLWLGLAAGALAQEPVRLDAAVYAYVFNVGSQDVTIIDTETNEVVETRPLGASVRWLSNEQDFWDGELIWTYDLVDGMVHLIAIDPGAMEVRHRVEIGQGPAHSVQLTPDRRHLLVNAAGDNIVAVVDRESMEVVRRIETGLFPCDIDFSPDGRFAYVPERDQHTVAAIDLERLEIVKRVSFAEGSRPHMLRVAPGGDSVWVQVAAAGTNEVLDPETLETIARQQIGNGPVTNAWTPDGRFSYVTHVADDFVSVIDAESYKEVERIRVGNQVGNVAFRPDGAYAYVTVIGEDKVVVIDTAEMAVVDEIPAGERPWGLVVMSPPEGR